MQLDMFNELDTNLQLDMFNELDTNLQLDMFNELDTNLQLDMFCYWEEFDEDHAQDLMIAKIFTED
jgi:hypothetical protein